MSLSPSPRIRISFHHGALLLEGPVLERPVLAEQSVAERSVAEQSVAGQSVAEQSVAEQSVAEQSVAGQPFERQLIETLLEPERKPRQSESLGRPRAGGVPGVVWDEAMQGYRAPAFRYRELVAALRALRCRVRDEVLRAPRVVPASWRMPKLRAYQRSALSAWHLGGHRGTVVLPRGAGKARLAMAAIRSVAPAKALCLVPSLAALEQWVAELSPCYGGAIGRFDGDECRPEAITVATFEDWQRWASDLGAFFDMLVVHVADPLGGQQGGRALELCTAPMRLGLAAKPPDSPAQEQRLCELVGRVQAQVSTRDLFRDLRCLLRSTGTSRRGLPSP